jgi:hypothetical protein
MLLCSQTNKGKEKCAKTKRNFNDNRMVKSEHFCSFLRLHTKVKCVACVVLCNTMCETLKCDARCPLPHISSSRPTTHFLRHILTRGKKRIHQDPSGSTRIHQDPMIRDPLFPPCILKTLFEQIFRHVDYFFF